MNVSKLALSTVSVGRLVNVPFGHFSDRADTELERIRRARLQVEKPLVQFRLIDEARLATHGRHRRVIGVGGQLHARFLGNGYYFVEKFSQPTATASRA